jgi:hypothetical protein
VPVWISLCTCELDGFAYDADTQQLAYHLASQPTTTTNGRFVAAKILLSQYQVLKSVTWQGVAGKLGIASAYLIAKTTGNVSQLGKNLGQRTCVFVYTRTSTLNIEETWNLLTDYTDTYGKNDCEACMAAELNNPCCCSALARWTVGTSYASGYVVRHSFCPSATLSSSSWADTTSPSSSSSSSGGTP